MTEIVSKFLGQFVGFLFITGIGCAAGYFFARRHR